MASNAPSICLTCRISFKQTGICPRCRQPMIDMGTRFKPPRRGNVLQWRKVELMLTGMIHPILLHCSCEHCSSWNFGWGRRANEMGPFKRGVFKARTLSDAKNQIHLRRNRGKVPRC